MTAKATFAEKLMARGFASRAADQCSKEPLTRAQADCLFAVKEPEQLDQLARCPAMLDHPPSWLGMRVTADLGVRD